MDPFETGSRFLQPLDYVGREATDSPFPPLGITSLIAGVLKRDSQRRLLPLLLPPPPQRGGRALNEIIASDQVAARLLHYEAKKRVFLSLKHSSLDFTSVAFFLLFLHTIISLFFPRLLSSRSGHRDPTRERQAGRQVERSGPLALLLILVVVVVVDAARGAVPARASKEAS